LDFVLHAFKRAIYNFGLLTNDPNPKMKPKRTMDETKQENEKISLSFLKFHSPRAVVVRARITIFHSWFFVVYFFYEYSNSLLQKCIWWLWLTKFC